jgi:hypothetical protein
MDIPSVGTAVAIGTPDATNRETKNMETTASFPQLAFNQWLARNLQDLVAGFTPIAAPTAGDQQ